MCTQQLNDKHKGQNKWHVLKELFEEEAWHSEAFIEFGVTFLRVIVQLRVLLFLLQPQLIPPPTVNEKSQR